MATKFFIDGKDDNNNEYKIEDILEKSVYEDEDLKNLSLAQFLKKNGKKYVSIIGAKVDNDSKSNPEIRIVDKSYDKLEEWRNITLFTNKVAFTSDEKDNKNGEDEQEKKKLLIDENFWKSSVFEFNDDVRDKSLLKVLSDKNYIPENKKFNERIVGAIVEGRTVDLNFVIDHPCLVKFLTVNSSEGRHIVRRSAAVLLQAIVRKHFPGKRIVISQTINSLMCFDYLGDVKFCQSAFSDDEIILLQKRFNNYTKDGISFIDDERPLSSIPSHLLETRKTMQKVVDDELKTAKGYTEQYIDYLKERIEKWERDKKDLLNGWPGEYFSELTIDLGNGFKYHDLTFGPWLPSAKFLKGMQFEFFPDSKLLLLGWPEKPGNDKIIFNKYFETFKINNDIEEDRETLNEEFKKELKNKCATVSAVARETNDWNRRHFVDTIPRINEYIRKNGAAALIFRSEAEQERRICKLADDIIEQGSNLILIGGPSGSGKTVLAYRLQEILNEKLGSPKRVVYMRLESFMNESYINEDKSNSGRDSARYYYIDSLDLTRLNKVLTMIFNWKSDSSKCSDKMFKNECEKGCKLRPYSFITKKLCDEQYSYCTIKPNYIKTKTMEIHTDDKDKFKGFKIILEGHLALHPAIVGECNGVCGNNERQTEGGLINEINENCKYIKPFYIYAAAMPQLRFDDANRVHTTTMRLLRRIVRDCVFRNGKARDVMSGWRKVWEAEEENIAPHQNIVFYHKDEDKYRKCANTCLFNTSVSYEMSILRTFAWPRLIDIGRTEKNYSFSRELLATLALVTPIQPDYIPANALLREFIGGSAYRNLF